MPNPARFPRFTVLRIGILLLCIPPGLGADEIRFDAASQWRQWTIPEGIVELSPGGVIRPVPIRKNINAALDAQRLGGGIRSVGSNPGAAALVLDGDPTTGWQPDLSAPLEDQFIEVNLGRAVSAYRVRLIFAQDAAPFTLFDLMLSTGEHKLDQVGNPIDNSLVYRVTERYKNNQRHQLTFELDQPLHTPIQFIRIAVLNAPPQARLTEIQVDAFGDNLLQGLLEKGGNIDIVTALELEGEAASLGNAFSLIDGDLTTRFTQRNEPRAPFDIHGEVTMDLGGVYLVDHVRLIGGVVVRSGGGGGIVTNTYISRRNFIYRFYEVLTSDGSLSPNGTRVWTKHFSDWANDETKRRGLADHIFTPLPTRFVRFRWRVWDAGCAFNQPLGAGGQAYTAQNCLVTGHTEEFQVFGLGFPQEVTLKSPLIDLASGKNLNALNWRSTTPPGTRVEIRTRTGNQVKEILTFHDKNGKEVTQKRYEKLIPSFRGSVDTLLVPGGDWSPWSKIYTASGDPFQSPSPRRFMEIEARLVSTTPDQAPSLDWLTVDFTQPLADRAIGEIAPIEVKPGETTEFTYFVRPQGRSTGFDRIAVEATMPLQFMDARIDQEPVEVQTEPTPTGFRLTFPRSIRDNQLLAVRFASSVFLQSTQFNLFLEDSASGPQVRQLVDPGDAEPLINSNTNVVSIPVNGRLFANLTLSPAILTPNGDGINDELLVQVDLVNVLAQRPLTLKLYDLSGRLLHSVTQEAVAGEQTLRWNGRAAGQRVPPGLYLVEVKMAGDAGDQLEQRLLPVVY